MNGVVTFLWHELIPWIINLGNNTLDIMKVSIGDLLMYLVEKLSGLHSFFLPNWLEKLMEWFENGLPGWAWLDYSVLYLMIGGGFLLYVAITVLKYVLDIIF